MPPKPPDSKQPTEQSREGQKAAAKKLKPEVTSHGQASQEKREARLAEALRENLRRRKAANKKDE